jgi:NADH:ubiquinone oxidoreductase subunit 5 (subunit L)/multisubunit Na+/H+ antiporter MnhA subunit
MLNWILPLIPALPLLAAAFLGCGIVAGRIDGEARERSSSGLIVGIAAISCLLAALALGFRETGLISEPVVLGTWLESGDYAVKTSFAADRLSLGLSLLFSLLILMVARFSVNYLHRETGFHRFFLVLGLFAGAMQLLVLGGNAVFTFIGWELAGVCSFLLIAYAYDRPVAAGNATRAFVTNRIGDAGFALGIVLAFAWTGGVEWSQIIEAAPRLGGLEAGTLAACFLLAATAKSALFPLSPWLSRAMEGPTPSSAVFYGSVMIHAGVYLVLRLQPVFEQAPWAMALMAAVGLVTALYGYGCGLTQTDVKSALIFSATGQIGLMFLAAGLGWWGLAAWHLAAHAVLRGFQFLTAPSLMHKTLGIPIRPLPAFAARCRWLYLASLQRFWLEELGDYTVVRPTRSLAADFHGFDNRVLDRAVGLPAPAMQGLSSLAEWEEHRLGADYRGTGDVRRVSGLLGLLVHGCASALHWFEERLVLKGVGRDLIAAGRRIGPHLNRVETALTRPRYLVLFVIVTLLATV